MAWPPQVWGALIGAVAGALLAALKYALDRRARAHEDLWGRRLEPYRQIWAMSAYFSRWPRQEPTRADASVLQERLRLWYYGDGGILMSGKARRRYEFVQQGLKAIKDGLREDEDRVHEQDYDQMTEILSRFRSALTDDLESRRKRSFAYSLVDLSRDHRVREELQWRRRKMLERNGLKGATADGGRGVADVVGRSLWEVLVIGACVAAAVIVMVSTSGPDDRDAAVATLAAAVIAVAGTSLGHTSGHRDAMVNAEPELSFRRHAVIIMAVVLVVAGTGSLVHFVLPDGLAVSRDAAAALCAAVLGIVGTVAANELFLRSTTHISVGLTLLVLSVAWGIVAIVRASQTSSADSGVAFAAAAVGVAGTLLGHAAGRRLNPPA